MREPYVSGRARGFRYREIPADIEGSIPRWLAEGRVAGGTELKAGSVYRLGAWVVKLGGPSPSVKDALRPASSIRIADLHARLLPIRTPAPVVALEVRRGRMLDASLLVAEFIDGTTLYEAFGRGDEPAVKALAPYLARLHARGVFHGDLHPWNLLWDGREWVLLDVASLRHPLRRLLRRRLILDQFAQFVFRIGEDPRLERCCVEYLAAAGLAWDPRATWEEVRRRGAAIRARFAPAS